MRNPHYSTKTAFDWLLSHYFLQGFHFAWVSPEFYPYKQSNPESSNPLRVYESFYGAWKDRDEFSPWITQKRIGLRKVIDLKVAAGEMGDSEAAHIKELIDSACPSLFYPIVYQIDLDAIQTARRRISGSGASIGSNEYLIVDLKEDEFSLLFGHFREDKELRHYVIEAPDQEKYLDSYQILGFIESRRISK